MNPNQPTPSPIPEQPSAGQPEQSGSAKPEQVNIPTPVESVSQSGAAAAPAVPISPQPPIVNVQPVDPAQTPAQPATGAAITTPAIADDVDVIEKEWVDHANKIIEATDQDPYVEEEAIEDLQVDYLRKRYGKEVKKDEPPTAV